jgi:hypothetical protein
MVNAGCGQFATFAGTRSVANLDEAAFPVSGFGRACSNANCSITSGVPIVLPDELSNIVADFQIEPDLIFADDFDS